MAYTQRFNEIFSPISPIELPDLTLYDPSHHPHEDPRVSRIDEDNSQTATWRKRSESTSKTQYQAYKPPTRGSDDQVTLVPTHNEGASGSASASVRSPPPNRLDHAASWGLALPAQDSALLRPPSTTLSRTSSRLEKPFSPYIPENMQLPPLQTDANSEEVDAKQPSPSRWPGVLLFILRLATLAACGAVFGLLAYSVSVYDSRKGSALSGNKNTIWPSNAYLVPDAVIFAVTFADFISCVLIIGMSLIRSTPSQSDWKDLFKISMSVFFTGAWVGGLVVFKILDKKHGGSLRYMACNGKNLDHDFATVCTVQNMAFYVGIGVGASELVAVIGLTVKVLLLRRFRRRLNAIETSLREEAWL